MIAAERAFYICPICFQVCESRKACDLHIHSHRMVPCNPGKPGDERRKPIVDNYGNFVSRAPRWYLEAVGLIKAQGN